MSSALGSNLFLNAHHVLRNAANYMRTVSQTAAESLLILIRRVIKLT